VALVDGAELRLLATHRSVYDFAKVAIETGERMANVIDADLSTDSLSYDDVYSFATPWRFLPAFDRPDEPARCLISGTGITHRGVPPRSEDGMRLYESGAEGGRPEPGAVGAAPEWFAKGSGTLLRGHGEPLAVPNFARGGGEEAEIVAVYTIDPDGVPRRIGMAPGNEFSDHRTRRLNSLYHAHAKHCPCAIGPELTLDPDFSHVAGSVAIERAGARVWSKPIETGDERMTHNLANLEHHHFKYEDHRRPGDAHIHFLGATAFSFADGFALEDGDEMVIEFDGFGRPLRNRLCIDRSPERPVTVSAI
jgi:hypothetical protein